MRKMAISGAFMMLPITPAMPARVKLMTDRSRPRKRLQKVIRMNPVTPPTKSEGANTPPIPPAAFVKAVAKGLSSSRASKKSSSVMSLNCSM